jgi:hypothetical protein
MSKLKLWWDNLFPTEENTDTCRDEVRCHCREHILFMLGAPVVQVELTDEQVRHCVNMAEEMVAGNEMVNTANFKRFMRDVSLAYAKVILGRIRSKFEAAPAPNGPVPTDGTRLVEEGSYELSCVKAALSY